MFKLCMPFFILVSFWVQRIINWWLINAFLILSYYNGLPEAWLEDNDAKAEEPIREEELDLIDIDDFLFDGLSVLGEGERIIPTVALTLCTCSILL